MNPPTGIASPVRRVAGIVLIFMLVGPPAGGIVFLVGRLIFFLVEDLIAGAFLPAYAGWLEIVVWALVLVLLSAFLAIGAAPFSYLYGIVPAAIAGLVIGILRVKYGRLNASIVFVVGGLIGVVYALAMSRLIQATASLTNQLLASGFGITRYFLYFVSCVAATFACWRFARSFPA